MCIQKSTPQNFARTYGARRRCDAVYVDLEIQNMYQHLAAKSGRQILARAGNFLDLPARRAGNVLHFVSIAGNNPDVFAAIFN